MFSIHRFPPFGKRFFKRIRKIIGNGQFSHLWRIVVGLASLQGKKSLSKFTKLYGKRRSRQAISHFLTETEWDAPELLLDNIRQSKGALRGGAIRRNEELGRIKLAFSRRRGKATEEEEF